MEKRWLYLDDIRTPKIEIQKWDIVRNYVEFKEYILKNGIPDLISFDHDLAEEHYVIPFDEWEYQPQREDVPATGFDCAKWLVDYCLDNDLSLKKVTVHSANPAGAANIVGLINNFKKFRGETQDCIRRSW